MPQHEDRMTARIMPPPVGSSVQVTVRHGTPPFTIVIAASDGVPLLKMTETPEGLLDVTGPDDRWSEAARRFVHAMMQWSGQVGINWREEAAKP